MILNKLFQKILFGLMVIVFISCIGLSLFDISFIKTNVSISDVWAAFSGISIPLTFFLFILDSEIKQNEDKKADLTRVYIIIELFLTDLDLFIEHLKLSFSFNLGILNALKDTGEQKRILSLMLSLYQINKLSPNDLENHRKNYLMRLKLDHAIKLVAGYMDNVTDYSNEKGLQVNLDGAEGDKAIHRHTLRLYKKQLSMYRSTLKDANSEILRNIKNSLEI